MGWLSNMFNKTPNEKPVKAANAEIGPDFQPSKGTFFRTLEFPETTADGAVTGRIWLEAGFQPDTNQWVLWQKSIREVDDVLRGGKSSVMSARPLFEKTDFVTAYDQMTTFEKSQASLGAEPLTNKTKAKLGGDYYKQFAWREGLMMARSGRLFPFNSEQVNAAGHFDAQDIADAKAYLDRVRSEQFVPVPIVLPAVDWEKAYAATQDITDKRLNALYFRFNNDVNNYDLALQIVGNEKPEVLFAHMRRGGNLKSFETDVKQHMGIIKAALARTNAESMELVAESGLSFCVRDGLDTPVELAVSQKRYSHLYVMLSRDGVTLANFADADGTVPAVHAMEQQDRQAFRMLYLEGLDYARADKNGYHIVHHAFANNFIPGIYAWLDEGLPIDHPVKGTAYTGLSIARHNGHAALADFAAKNGANAAAPALPVIAKPAEPVAPVAPVAPVTVDTIPAFTADLLNSDATNDIIEKSARAHAASGGAFDDLDAKGASILELCWKNRKATDASRDRRALLPVFAVLGVDPTAPLSDGTTVLTRAASGLTLDMDFIKAMAPLARDVNKGDAQGNNILHAVQINKNDAVGHSNNVAALLKLFPALDLNRQNADGLSNVGLAIRLNRSQTLKAFAAAAAPDLTLETASGTSYLAMTFTRACAAEKVTGSVKAATIKVTSDAVREAVLDILESAPDKHAAAITESLLAKMQQEQAPAAMISRLRALTPKQA
jgi:ankyrin repeat protein